MGCPHGWVWDKDLEIFHSTGDTRDVTVIPDSVKQHRQNDIYTSFTGLARSIKEWK